MSLVLPCFNVFDNNSQVTLSKSVDIVCKYVEFRKHDSHLGRFRLLSHLLRHLLKQERTRNVENIFPILKKKKKKIVIAKG